MGNRSTGKHISGKSWIEDHNGTRVFGRDGSPEVENQIRAMKKKIEAIKERVMAKVVQDEKLLEYIEKQKMNVEQLKEATGVSQLTLQVRIGKLHQKVKRFLEVPGLYDDEIETIKFGQPGIRLSKGKLEGYGFKEGDSFEVEFDKEKNRITLTKTKDNADGKGKGKGRGKGKVKKEQPEQDVQPVVHQADQAE